MKAFHAFLVAVLIVLLSSCEAGSNSKGKESKTSKFKSAVTGIFKKTPKGTDEELAPLLPKTKDRKKVATTTSLIQDATKVAFNFALAAPEFSHTQTHPNTPSHGSTHIAATHKEAEEKKSPSDPLTHATHQHSDHHLHQSSTQMVKQQLQLQQQEGHVQQSVVDSSQQHSHKHKHNHNPEQKEISSDAELLNKEQTRTELVASNSPQSDLARGTSSDQVNGDEQGNKGTSTPTISSRGREWMYASQKLGRVTEKPAELPRRMSFGNINVKNMAKGFDKTLILPQKLKAEMKLQEAPKQESQSEPEPEQVPPPVVEDRAQFTRGKKPEAPPLQRKVIGKSRTQAKVTKMREQLDPKAGMKSWKGFGYVWQELISTEETYVIRLGHLQNKLISVLPKELLEKKLTVLPYYTELYKFHYEFVAALKQVAAFSGRPGCIFPNRFADALKVLPSITDKYKYILSHQDEVLPQKYRERDPIKSILENYDTSFNVDADLILPTQRITRYSLLLKNLVAEANPACLEKLNEVLTVMSAITEDINEARKKYEDDSKINFLIKKRLVEPDPTRTLLFHQNNVPVSSWALKTEETPNIYLLSDALIQCPKLQPSSKCSVIKSKDIACKMVTANVNGAAKKYAHVLYRESKLEIDLNSMSDVYYGIFSKFCSALPAVLPEAK